MISNRIKRRSARKYARLDEMRRMDVQEEYSRIWWMSVDYEFPWDFSVAGALAFYNSVAPPHLAALLVETGELTENTQRRLEHFGLISLEIARRGFKDPRGRAAVRQMNRIHKNAVKSISNENRQWSISNDDYLFVLATSMVIPARWVDQHAWRPLSQHERTALFLHIRKQGELMGIKDIPDSYDGLVKFHDDFVEKHFRYSPEAEKLWKVLEGMIIDPFVGWLPEKARPLGRRVARVAAPALLTPHMREAFGVREPSRLLSLAVDTAIRVRSAYVRLQPPRTEPSVPDPLPTPSFPTGEFDIEKLGPAHTTGVTATG